MSTNCSANPTWDSPACKPGDDKSYYRKHYCCDIDLESHGKLPITLSSRDFQTLIQNCSATGCDTENARQVWYNDQAQELNLAPAGAQPGNEGPAKCNCECTTEHCSSYGDTGAKCKADVDGLTCTCSSGYKGSRCSILSNTLTFTGWLQSSGSGTCTKDANVTKNYPKACDQTNSQNTCNAQKDAMTCMSIHDDTNYKPTMIDCCTWTPDPPAPPKPAPTTCKEGGWDSAPGCEAAEMGKPKTNPKCHPSGCTAAACCSPK